MTSSPITMYGAEWCSDCRRSKALLDARGVAYEYVDLEAVTEGADRAFAISGRTSIPVIAFADGTHQVEPSNAELEGKLRELGVLA
ncbi:NrdH-redoxin [Glaciihabitans arcticus]|uniref:NrdH-redoxin n=1 Tax=Glaciihabitans arcticus TaxID=2668039 RepID=A0A4Q9GRE3_9MICO|nr:glutaredoxin domain-containing protein [Glaciihabitans arcticus]TBN56634.1 NrdH-redoxin [Glaciihabitans arcticus]